MSKSSQKFPELALIAHRSDSLRRFSTLMSALVITGGVLACIGWQFRIPLLRGDFKGTFIAPNTALLSVLFGTSLLLQLKGLLRASRIGKILAYCCFCVSGNHLRRTPHWV